MFFATKSFFHAPHFIGDFVVTFLLVSSSVTIHLVDANTNLLHSEKVDQPRVPSDHSLDFNSLAVPLGDRRGEVFHRLEP